jgi:lysine 2,3-aminomutase
VLLTGGDPLVASTGKLEKLIRQLWEIDNVRIIRIGSKMPAFNPFRIINDPSLLEMFGRYSAAGKKIYVMGHFNHPRELTEPAAQCLSLLQKAGVTVVNQSPIIRGVNDSAEVIAELLGKLSFIGVTPYYLFICRPTLGNKPFLVPIEASLEMFERARSKVSGVARQARLCLSHKTGKIEVVGKTKTNIIFRYHRAANPVDHGRLMSFNLDPEACWFDDYTDKQAD